jgi:hypothetical protein
MIKTSNCRRQTPLWFHGQLDSLELSGSRGLPGLCLFDFLALLNKVVEMYKTHGRLGEAFVHRIVLPNEPRGRRTRFLRFLHGSTERQTEAITQQLTLIRACFCRSNSSCDLRRQSNPRAASHPLTHEHFLALFLQRSLSTKLALVVRS